MWFFKAQLDSFLVEAVVYLTEFLSEKSSLKQFSVVPPFSVQFPVIEKGDDIIFFIIKI